MTLKDFLNEGDKFAKYIGIDLVEVKPGTAKATMTVTEHHMNAGNIQIRSKITHTRSSS